MYHSIVNRKIRATFDGLSEGQASALTNKLATDFEYHYVGDHALGGTRTNRADMLVWFDRLFTIFPGIAFEVQDVVVKGMPWQTTAMAHVAIDADGHPNEMFQRITLSWGRITSVRTLVNLEALQANLGRRAEEGATEAVAAPINS